MHDARSMDWETQAHGVTVSVFFFFFFLCGAQIKGAAEDEMVR